MDKIFSFCFDPFIEKKKKERRNPTGRVKKKTLAN